MFLMYVTKQSLIRVLVILTLMPLMVLSMNCGRTGVATTGASHTLATKSVAPISFVNIDQDGRCGPGPRVRARILIDPLGGPELVTQDCHAISPRGLSVSEIGLLPHNLTHAIYEGRLFERFETDPQSGAVPEASTRLLCRGSSEGKVVDLTVVGEVLTTKIAAYENGRYVKTLDVSESRVHETSAGFAGADFALELDRKAFSARLRGPRLSLSLDCVSH